MESNEKLNDHQLDEITDEAVERAADEAVRVVELYLRKGGQGLSTDHEDERGLLTREVLTPLAKESIRFEVAGGIETALFESLRALNLEKWSPPPYIEHR